MTRPKLLFTIRPGLMPRSSLWRTAQRGHQAAGDDDETQARAGSQAAGGKQARQAQRRAQLGARTDLGAQDTKVGSGPGARPLSTFHLTGRRSAAHRCPAAGERRQGQTRHGAMNAYTKHSVNLRARTLVRRDTAPTAALVVSSHSRRSRNCRRSGSCTIGRRLHPTSAGR